MATVKRAIAGLVLVDFFIATANTGKTAKKTTASRPAESSGMLGVGVGVGLVVDSISVLVAAGGVLLGLVSWVVAVGCVVMDVVGCVVGEVEGVDVGDSVGVGVGLGACEGVGVGEELFGNG